MFAMKEEIIYDYTVEEELDALRRIFSQMAITLDKLERHVSALHGTVNLLVYGPWALGFAILGILFFLKGGCAPS